jgi:hypothetical protein
MKYIIFAFIRTDKQTRASFGGWGCIVLIVGRCFVFPCGYYEFSNETAVDFEHLYWNLLVF